MKFKIGDRIVPKDGKWRCVHAETVGADYAVITGLTEGAVAFYKYDLYKNGVKRNSCTVMQDDNNSKLMEKTMENLQVGDVIVSNSLRGEHTVLEVLTNTVLISVANIPDSIAGWRTFDSLKRSFTIKSDEPETTELTMDEIAKLAGVDVKNLKIKKQ